MVRRSKKQLGSTQWQDLLANANRVLRTTRKSSYQRAAELDCEPAQQSSLSTFPWLEAKHNAYNVSTSARESPAIRQISVVG